MNHIQNTKRLIAKHLRFSDADNPKLNALCQKLEGAANSIKSKVAGLPSGYASVNFIDDILDLANELKTRPSQEGIQDASFKARRFERFDWKGKKKDAEERLKDANAMASIQKSIVPILAEIGKQKI